mmetsp:Transcript_12642/g.20825  ORF Transcript_12642/g.20825 Transcript_12642/m.20825 type:complete len:164 (-) Transcript_12642:1225-1716(-)
MKIEQFLVFLHRSIVAITRQVVEAMQVVEDGIPMEDGVIRIAEEDRIVTIAKTIREEESAVVVEAAGEIIPKVLLEEVTIKEAEVRITVRVEEEVDRAIIREVVSTQTNKAIEAKTRNNILKVQEVTVMNVKEAEVVGIIMTVDMAADEAGNELFDVYYGFRE